VSYRLVQSLQTEAVPVRRVCHLLGVSRSGYYAAQHRPARQKAHQEVVHLKAAFADSGRSYGSRRLQAALRAKGFVAGRTRVRRWMREQGLRPVWKRKFVATTDSRHDLPVFDNILNRQFAPAEPNRAWVADITYIRTRAGWLYLAVVLDLFSRKVVGWAMAPTCRQIWSVRRCKWRLPNDSLPPDWWCILTGAASMRAPIIRRYWQAMA